MDTDSAEYSNTQAYHTIVNWLNEAATSKGSEKADAISKVSEVLVHKEPNLLPQFLDHVLSYQVDQNVEVRKNVVSFIEAIGKKHHSLIPKVLPSLLMLLRDSSLQVQKKVIQASSTLYREVVRWLSMYEKSDDENAMMEMWNLTTSLKSHIINLVDNDHVGILNHTVKFMQTIIVLQTSHDSDDKQIDNISIFDVPMTMKFTKRRKLEEEAMVVFDLLVKFNDSKHISSTSLMTCMTVLTSIALARPQFLGRVIAALETVHTHLPPDLSESQVSAVRKHLKWQLLSLLKHPACSAYQQNITTLLTDLGVSQNEVQKVLPKDDDRKRKLKKYPENSQPTKKIRADESTTQIIDSGLDVTEAWIFERLSPQVATKLIMDTLVNLPSKMPSLFNSTYTPIAVAGNTTQVKHVSRLLATQLHTAGLGPGSAQPTLYKPTPVEPMAEDDDVVEVKPLPIVPILRTPRTLKLSEITHPLEEETREQLAVDAVRRVLETTRDTTFGSATRARVKIITSMATTFGLRVRESIREYILEDIKQRLDLALAWLYEEYSILQGFYKLPEILQHNQKPDHNYNTLLCSLLLTIVKNPNARDRDSLYLEAPLITEKAMDVLKELSTQEKSIINLLKQLVLKKPGKQLIFLNMLLELTSHHTPEIHQYAMELVVELYEKIELRHIIENYAFIYLDFLRLPNPPDVLFGPEKGMVGKVEVWTEPTVKCCSRLCMALLTLNDELMKGLTEVYAATDSDIKRIILRQIEIPILNMNVSSPQLLKLVDDFPKGAETLVTRMLHVVTDKIPPSPELVEKVKQLYQSRVSDVRFIIPVLSGFSKADIFDALPELIKQNVNVVKEVFNRLISSADAPITPAELLIALHKIENNACELKYVIKATSICFGDKVNFTQEVLAVVIQNLMDITPLPTLLMRTVIQALSFYPRLIGFGMNILQRLILKQVWKYRKVWEGFIKCCERTKPNSFQVLLQLPPDQLQEVFHASPTLKPALYSHIATYDENQRSHISQAILDTVYGLKTPVYNEFTIKAEPASPPDLTIDIKDEPRDDLMSLPQTGFATG